MNKHLAACEAKASQLKVGLVTFVDPSDVSTWDVRVKAERRVENFEKQDLFLTHKMTQEGQAQMRAWSSSISQSSQKYGKFTCSG